MLLSRGDISKSIGIIGSVDGTEKLSIVCDLGKLYSLAGLSPGRAAGQGAYLTGVMEGFRCGDIESECLLNSNHVDFTEPSFWEDESYETCPLDARESSEMHQVLDDEEEETKMDCGSIGIETQREKESGAIPYLNPNNDAFQMSAKPVIGLALGNQISDLELGDGCCQCPHKLEGDLIKCWKCARRFCRCCLINGYGTNFQRQMENNDDGALQLCPTCKNWQPEVEPTSQITHTASLTAGFSNADNHLVYKTTSESAPTMAHSKYSCWAGISDSNSMMPMKTRKVLRTEGEEESTHTLDETEVSTKITPKRKDKTPQPQGKRMQGAADLCAWVPTVPQEQIMVVSSLVDASFTDHKVRYLLPSAMDKSTIPKQEPADNEVQQGGFHVNSWCQVDGKQMQGSSTAAHQVGFETELADVKPFLAVPGITNLPPTPSKLHKRDTTSSSQAATLRNRVAPFEAAPGNVYVNVDDSTGVLRKHDSDGAFESPVTGIFVQHIQKTASGEVNAKGFQGQHTMRVKVESTQEISITGGGGLSPESDSSQPGSLAKSNVTAETVSMDRVDALKTVVCRHLFGSLCTVAGGKETETIALHSRHKKDAMRVGDKLSLPSCLQAKTYGQKLKAEAGEPFDRKQYADMWELVNRRKPLLRLRHTRTRTVQFSTKDEGFSYLDHHPDLAARLAEAETLEEKLKLLRGFFFWLQHSCMDGAFKPWAPSPHDTGQAEDCIETDGPDCEVLAVVLQLDEKKDVRSLFDSRSQLPLGCDTDGVSGDPHAIFINLEDTGLQKESIGVQMDNFGAREAAIQKRMGQKSSTCRNCSKEFGTEKRRQRTLYDVCGHTDTCMACVFTLRKLDKRRCPTCGVAPHRKPKPFVENNNLEDKIQ